MSDITNTSFDPGIESGELQTKLKEAIKGNTVEKKEEVKVSQEVLDESFKDLASLSVDTAISFIQHKVGVNDALRALSEKHTAGYQKVRKSPREDFQNCRRTNLFV